MNPTVTMQSIFPGSSAPLAADCVLLSELATLALWWLVLLLGLATYFRWYRAPAVHRPNHPPAAQTVPE